MSLSSSYEMQHPVPRRRTEPITPSEPPGRQITPSASESLPPKSYLDRISELAKRPPCHYFSTGLHYKGIAEKFFGISPWLGTSQPPRAVDAGARPFGHVFCYVWNPANSGNALVSRSVSGVDDDPGQSDVMKPRPQNSGTLIIIRGCSKSEWLLPLCARHCIDPEFLRRHLDFLQPGNYFDSNPLPSASRDIFTLKVTTICVRKDGISSSMVRDLRKNEDRLVQQQNQASRQPGLIGGSIIRRWSFHDEKIFTIEQYITVAVRKHEKTKGWTAVAWSDLGRDIVENTSADRLETDNLNAGTMPAYSAVPIVRHRREQPLGSKKSTIPFSDYGGMMRGLPSDTCPHQNGCHLPAQYGADLDHRLAGSDALYALEDFFALSADSESQFLTMMREQVEKNMKLMDWEMEHSFQDLTHSKVLVDEHVQDLNAKVILLRERQLSDWPRVIDNHNRAKSLLVDFESLLIRAQALSKMCLEGTQMVMNRASLKEAQKSLDQNETTKRLTVLAFLYLPLNLTAGIFGMNFNQLDNLDMWYLAPVLLVLVTSSSILCFWDWISQYLPHTKLRRPRFR